MSKRPNLAEVAAAAGSTRKAPQPETRPAPGPEPEQAAPAHRRASTRASGTKQVAAHFPAEVAWQLRELAVERRSTVQALIGEALNDLFQKHGKPEIVPRDMSSL
jgi:hypothetical protein